MNVLNYAYDEDKKLIVRWNNGLTISCMSITGEYETDTEIGDDNYIGEYAAAIGDVVVLQQGMDDSMFTSFGGNSGNAAASSIEAFAGNNAGRN